MQLLDDLKYGLRLLRRNLRYSFISMFTLAMGIGATAVIFSLIDATLLQRLPFFQPARLVFLSEMNPEVSSKPVRVSVPDFEDWKNQSQVFEVMAAYRDREFTLRGAEPLRVSGAMVSPEFFQVLGAGAAGGRTFTPDDEGRRVAVISDDFRQKHTAHTLEQVMGSQITLDDTAYTIVGVMSPKFRFLQQSDVWVPLEISSQMRQMRGAHFLDVIGRLRSGVDLVQAQAEMKTVAGQLAQAYPATNAGWIIRVESLTEKTSGNIRQRLVLLFGAVLFVLLITCTNIAGLLLARVYARQREFATRIALGASRKQIMGQMLGESLAIALPGGILGLLLGVVGIRLMPSWRTISALRIDAIHLDPTVLFTVMAVAVFSSLFFGIIPALEASRMDVNGVLKDAAAGTSSSSFRSQRLRTLLIVGEIALAQVLLSGAGLFCRSLLRLESVDMGFSPDHVISMQVPLARGRYAQPAEQAQFFDNLLQRVRALPQFPHAAVTNAIPLGGADPKLDFSIEGRPEVEWASARIISPDYFRTMGIPLRDGREFAATDNRAAPAVVVISDALAKRFRTAGIAPLNHRLQLGANAYTVAGIVGSVRETSLSSDWEPEFYFPMAQMPNANMVLVARTEADPPQAAADLRAVLRGLDANQPVAKIETIAEVLSNSVAAPRFSALLFGSLAALALVLAIAGVYGLVSYIVEMRTHEFGIRLALGAEANHITKLVLKRGLLLGVAGSAIGLTSAQAFSRLLSSLLFGITATDVITMISVCGLLLLVMLVACYIPAVRAGRITPIEAIRADR